MSEMTRIVQFYVHSPINTISILIILIGSLAGGVVKMLTMDKKKEN